MLILVVGTVEGLRLEHSFLLLVMWGSQKQNKEKFKL